MTERTGQRWNGSIGGMCPVQGWGTVDGHPWYFRARGQRWSFSVAEDPKGDPVDVWDRRVPGWHYEEPWGEDEFAAGYMDEEIAWGFIEACIAKLRANELPGVVVRAGR